MAHDSDHEQSTDDHGKGDTHEHKDHEKNHEHGESHGDGHGEHHLNYEQERQVKHEMIKRLSPYYEHHMVPLIFRPFQWFHKIPNYTELDLSKYQHPSLESFTERQIVNRTVFALQKIKTFNHHFFTTQETRVLDSLPVGAITYSLWYGLGGVNALLLAYCWKNWVVTPKSILLVAGGLFAQATVCEIPNLLCEKLIQSPRRKSLARKYISAYGSEFFHNIIDPRFDLSKLEHMHNGQVQHH